MRIGAQIANQLPKLMGAKEVAKQLGISETAVRKIECRALFKIQQQLREFCINERIAT